MNESANDLKTVEWSDDDQCFVDQCPGIIGPRCHGDNDLEVYAELCDIVDEWLRLLKARGEPFIAPADRGAGFRRAIGQERLVACSREPALPVRPRNRPDALRTPDPALWCAAGGATTLRHRRDRSLGATVFVPAT